MAKNKGKKVKVEATEFDVSVLLAEAPITHKSNFLSVQLSVEQRAGLMSLLEGLRIGKKQLKDGQFVSNCADAVRWVFEQMPVHVDSSTDKRIAKVT